MEAAPVSSRSHHCPSPEGAAHTDQNHTIHLSFKQQDRHLPATQDHHGSDHTQGRETAPRLPQHRQPAAGSLLVQERRQGISHLLSPHPAGSQGWLWAGPAEYLLCCCCPSISSTQQHKVEIKRLPPPVPAATLQLAGAWIVPSADKKLQLMLLEGGEGAPAAPNNPGGTETAARKHLGVTALISASCFGHQTVWVQQQQEGGSQEGGGM